MTKSLRYFFMFLCMLCSTATFATDNLITEQIMINIDKAGTLRSMVSEAKKNKITNLKLSGELNVDDFKFVRELAGCYNDAGQRYDGNLQHIDLGDVRFIGDGELTVSIYDNSPYIHNGSDIATFTNNTIGRYLFMGLDKMQSIVLPEGLSSIDFFAFCGCTSLVSISLPKSLTSIDSSAFAYCTSLASISLPEGLVSIGSYVFGGCTNLASITLPNSLISIGTNAFKRCPNLKYISLPKSMTSIGEYAFSSSGITSISLPKGLKEIDTSAFLGCTITSVSLPEGLTSIAALAFHGCVNLKSISLPSSITSIGSSCFEGCTGLASIYMYAEQLPTMTGDVFSGCDADNCILYVPKGTMDMYRQSDFGYFKNIVELDATGINNPETSINFKEVYRYATNGRRLLTPTKGINVVKYSNGIVKKELVK